MVDPVYNPYVVLVRNRRVDIAGPFASDGVALDWTMRWSRFTGDYRTAQTRLLDDDPFAIFAYRPENANDLARLCASIDLDGFAARHWAGLNRHRFADGFPSMPLTSVTEEAVP